MFRTASFIAALTVTSGALAAQSAPRALSELPTTAEQAMQVEARNPDFVFSMPTATASTSSPLVSIPTPGAVALVGLAGLVTSRRRSLA